MSDNIFFKRTSAGIPVVVENIQESESVGYMVAVGTGSRDENLNVVGISHLLEHVVFRETKTKSSYEMAKEMEGAGGELNAFTSRELTAFYGVTIKESKEVAKEMVSEIVSNPLINEKDVELEKKIVLQELSMIKNEPDSYIHDLSSQNMWRGHPLCQDEGGTTEVVKGLGSEELKAYYEERYGIPNIAVFAAGDVDIDDTVAWAEEKFEGMAANKISRTKPKTPSSAYFFEANKSEHCHMAMGFPTYSSEDPRRTAASILNAVIGSGTSSRLFQEVREKKALVYAVYNVTEQYSDAGDICTFMSSTDENVIESLTTAAKVFSDFKKNGLEKEELARTKKMIKGAIVRSMESTEHRMYRLGRDFMLNGRCQSIKDRLKDIENVSEEDIMKVAEEIFTSKTLNITVLGQGNRHIKKFNIDQLDI